MPSMKDAHVVYSDRLAEYPVGEELAGNSFYR
jgi:hypothetical protein